MDGHDWHILAGNDQRFITWTEICPVQYSILFKTPIVVQFAVPDISMMTLVAPCASETQSRRRPEMKRTVMQIHRVMD